MKKSVWICLVLFLFPFASLYAQAVEGKKYQVAITEFPPFVILDKGVPSGFDIDYWGKVFKDLNIDVEYKVVSLPDKLKGLASGQYDFGLGGVSITSEREAQFNFSQPYFNSGLGILVDSKNMESNPFHNIFLVLMNPQIWGAILIFLISLFISGFVLWVLDHGSDGGISKKFIPGWLEGSWCAWAIKTTVGFGDIAPKKWPARVAGVFIGIVGMLIYGSVQGTIASQLTVRHLRGAIQGVEDLKGKVVSVRKGSTSAAVAKEYGIIPLETSSIQDSVDLMFKGESVAVVGDFPTLYYFCKNKGLGKCALVGGLFKPQYYGLCLSNDNTTLEEINRVHLRFQEDGTYASLYHEYFNDETMK